jgi:hypothetical protein
MKLEDMGSVMTDDHFMVQVLNNLASNHEKQMKLLENKIGDINLLEVDKLCEESNLQYERLSSQAG